MTTTNAEPTSIIGWRIFRPQIHGSLLTSPIGSNGKFDPVRQVISTDPYWPPARQKFARCLVDSTHVPPVAGCGCGVFAVASLHELLASPWRRFLGLCVVGLVELSGGLLLVGDNTDWTDPPTTWAGASGRVLQLHFNERLRTRQLGSFYDVPGFVWPESRWSCDLFAMPPRDVAAELAVDIQQVAARWSPELFRGHDV